MTFSDYALREGVLLDTMQRTRGGSLHHLRDVSRRSVRDVAELFDEEPEHSAHVARLALELFDATSTLHGLDEGCREYLEAAALLANVGLFISHSQHHLHSYYVIRNSERLTGFTDAEIEIIAQIARYHRKSAPKPSHAEFAALRPRTSRSCGRWPACCGWPSGSTAATTAGSTGLRARRRGQVLLDRPARRARRRPVASSSTPPNARTDLLEEVLGLRVDVVSAN